MSAHVYVHGSIGLGELRRCWDALVTQGRHWRPCDHGPGHAGAIILQKHKTAQYHTLDVQDRQSGVLVSAFCTQNALMQTHSHSHSRGGSEDFYLSPLSF